MPKVNQNHIADISKMVLRRRIEGMNNFTVKWIDEKGVERSKNYKTLNDATYARNWLLKNGAKQVEIFINK